MEEQGERRGFARCVGRDGVVTFRSSPRMQLRSRFPERLIAVLGHIVEVDEEVVVVLVSQAFPHRDDLEDFAEETNLEDDPAELVVRLDTVLSIVPATPEPDEEFATPEQLARAKEDAARHARSLLDTFDVLFRDAESDPRVSLSARMLAAGWKRQSQPLREALAAAGITPP